MAEAEAPPVVVDENEGVQTAFDRLHQLHNNAHNIESRKEAARMVQKEESDEEFESFAFKPQTNAEYGARATACACANRMYHGNERLRTSCQRWVREQV